jgi:hypothetical protein
MITFFENLQKTDQPHYRSLNFAISRIRNGDSMELVSKIRRAESKEERNTLKRLLPAVCFGGQFESRSADGLIKPSGYMTIDFDGFKSDEDLNAMRFELELDNYTHVMFTSPSGDGLKVIVKIPDADKKTYKGFFKAIQEHYNSPNFDKACSDISRITYESYDPDVFINEQSDTWTNVFKEVVKDKVVAVPTDDASKIVKGLMSWWDKNYGLVSGSRNHNLFVLAAAFNEYGIPKQEALSTCLQFEQSDFTAQEITTTVNSAYAKIELHGTSQWEDQDAKQTVVQMVAQSVPTEDIKRMVPSVRDEYIDDLQKSIDPLIFWTIDPKNGSVVFQNHLYRDFLVQNGYWKYYAHRDGTFVLVQVDGNVMREVMDEHIKDFVIEYLYELEDKRPFNAYANNLKIQKEDFLSFLPNINMRFLKDSKDVCYVYYKNCVVKLTESTVEPVAYNDMDGVVWEKNILKRDFVNSEYDGCVFERFLANISGNDPKRMITMKSTIGYMLHRYNDPVYNPAVILNDETISDKPEGGTGKGIFVKALSKIRKTEYIDGKSFDPKDKFAYQRVTIDTQIIAFQDVLKSFDFELLFSKLTDGMPIEVKFQAQSYIEFEDIAKMIITTNHAIRGDGNSHSRRKWEVEFTKYYTKEFTPFTEFGHTLFEEWDDAEWARFDNFMVSCIQLYLSKGLLSSEFKNLRVRQLEVSTSPEFREWILGDDKKYPMSPNYEYTGQDLLNDFIENYPDYRTGGPMRFTNRRFYTWLNEYARFKYGTSLIEGRSSLGKTIKFYEPEKQQKLRL